MVVMMDDDDVGRYRAGFEGERTRHLAMRMMASGLNVSLDQRGVSAKIERGRESECVCVNTYYCSPILSPFLTLCGVVGQARALLR